MYERPILTKARSPNSFLVFMYLTKALEFQGPWLFMLYLATTVLLSLMSSPVTSVFRCRCTCTPPQALFEAGMFGQETVLHPDCFPTVQENTVRGLPSMTSALEGGGGGVGEKWTRVVISCVIMYVTRGGGGQKIRNFHGRH